MESFKQQPKSPEAKESDETNEAKIEKDFVGMSSDKIELLASHLMRPDGFIKALIVGKILTSEEISKKIGHGFARTHRGYYMTFPTPDEKNQTYHASNDYVSFSIGVPQTMYTRSSYVRAELGGTSPGLGFILPASGLLNQNRVTPGWGMFKIEESLKEIKKRKLMKNNLISIAIL
ncbi:MAG: hypothetical protein HY225_01375 [Candidatus Vogelbacteria bacterium]|nr:hypothetical protein [Candidatus Vogelbacteria bacterium]